MVVSVKSTLRLYVGAISKTTYINVLLVTSEGHIRQHIERRSSRVSERNAKRGLYKSASEGIETRWLTFRKMLTIHNYSLYFCEVTDSMQYRLSKANHGVSNTNHFGSVSGSRGRLAAAGQCMASYDKVQLRAQNDRSSVKDNIMIFERDG